MTETNSLENRGQTAVRASGNGFYYAIRRFVGAAMERRRKAFLERQLANHVADLPAYLQRDIGWPPRLNHDKR
jgi:hypothetical protein